MNKPDAEMPLTVSERLPSPEATLRKLFLTLFLRGRSARGLKKQSAPKSVGKKLAAVLVVYALVGLMALAFVRQPVFALSAYLHAMTIMFLGMFVASSAGEILFNKEEADILLHRPIEPRTLLWAKIRVLVEVSLWLAIAFNLAGLFVGVFTPDGSWLFTPVHLLSTVLEALFCTSTVVMVYQLCLRWFGRERLEGLMTIAQILLSVGIVLSSQLLPRLMFRIHDTLKPGETPWWINLLPPAWFAGIDDALVGTGSPNSWLLAALAILVTSFVLWIAFGKLSSSYHTGLQALNETISPSKVGTGRRRWIPTLVDSRPLCWVLGNPVTRASFLLTVVYLIRDRDVKLRIYPGIAPMMIFPFIFLLRGFGSEQATSQAFGDAFGIAFAGGYLGIVPLMGVTLLQYSQQWQAADIFRIAPLPGPAPLCDGARRAILVVMALPLLVVFALIALLMRGNSASLFLLLPGVIALPVYALMPNMGGKAIPLSVPADESKSAGRGLTMMAVMLISMGLSVVAYMASIAGWFWQFVVAELVIVIVVHSFLRFILNRTKWPTLD